MPGEGECRIVGGGGEGEPGGLRRMRTGTETGRVGQTEASKRVSSAYLCLAHRGSAGLRPRPQASAAAWLRLSHRSRLSVVCFSTYLVPALSTRSGHPYPPRRALHHRSPRPPARLSRLPLDLNDPSNPPLGLIPTHTIASSPCQGAAMLVPCMTAGCPGFRYRRRNS